MALLRVLTLRFLSLLLVLLLVLFLLVLLLGATGYSERLLRAAIGEELRTLQAHLAQTLRDPSELERALKAREEELERAYGLDRPWYGRLPALALQVLRLDLGEARVLRSTSGSSRIRDILLERIPNTLLLLTTAFLLSALLGIGLGAWLATRAGSLPDRLVAYLAAASGALPTWWVGILLILLFAFTWPLFPSGGMYSLPPPEGRLARFLDLVWHATLPVLTLVLVNLGPYAYAVRTLLLSVAQEDHVLLARAKGLPERFILYRHVLRVAAPPILTGLILGLAGSLGGSILVETVFGWQGMGRLYYEAAAGTPDEGVMVALTYLYTLLYVGARMFLEVLYLYLDPRVAYA
jgi:peptide/nickel transport system permease protein